MSVKTNGVKHSMSLTVKGRRLRALERLDAQLQLGKKPIKNQVGDHNGMTELTASDIKRINKEMEILKKRC